MPTSLIDDFYIDKLIFKKCIDSPPSYFFVLIFRRSVIEVKSFTLQALDPNQLLFCKHKLNL